MLVQLVKLEWYNFDMRITRSLAGTHPLGWEYTVPADQESLLYPYRLEVPVENI
jgi:hypothetical protein